MPLNNFGRLSRVLSYFFLFSLVLNLAHAETSIWDSFRRGKGLFSDDSGQVCVGLDQATRGVCMTRRNCGNQGGKVVGYCGVSSTCCSLTTCGYSISSKEAILNMPNVGRNFPGLECSYNIVPHNRYVSQIRIDLEILTLSQPTADNDDLNGNVEVVESLGRNGGWNDNGRSGGNGHWNGNGGWNNGNNSSNNGTNGNSGWNDGGNNGNVNNNYDKWNNNGSKEAGNNNGYSNGRDRNNRRSNNGGNGNGRWNNGTNGNDWQEGRNDNINGGTTNTTSSSTLSGTVDDLRSSSGDHQRYRKAVEDGEIKSDYDEEAFFGNGGPEDLVQTSDSFGGEYDDGWNDEVVNSEDYNTWNRDRIRADDLNTKPSQFGPTSSTTSSTTTTTPAPTITRRTNPRPNSDIIRNHRNNQGGRANENLNGKEDDQPQEYKCQHDVFKVTNYVDSTTIIPNLCGENSGQHFYISLDSFKGSGIRISLKIADRQNEDNLAIPNWRIRIRQIEDRGRRNARDLDDVNRRDETINTGVGGLFAAVSGRTHTPDIGEQLLAPAGCLQYYPERTGTIESFNYNSGKGPYPPKLRYAICFKRTSSVCGVKLMARKFQLSSLRNKNNQVDSDCEGPDRDNRRGDYLLIPDGVSKLGLRGTKWCGNSVQRSVVAFASPGPLYVFFNSDNYISQKGKEIGFKMSFAVLNNC